MSVGVVIGRFQVAALHEGHIALLSAVAQKCTRMVVLVGVSAAPANAHDPLPYFCREDAIRTAFPAATVLPLPDCRTDAEWSSRIDLLLAPFLDQGPIRLYGGRESALPHYSGIHRAEALAVESLVSGTQIRRDVDLGFSLDFRLGLVYATKLPLRFPTSYQTVDIAVRYEHLVLVGRKADEVSW